MIAITFYGPNGEGFPENFPKLVRPDADKLLTSEDALMSEDEYRDYKANADEKSQTPQPKTEIISEIKAEAQRRIVGMMGYSPDQSSQWTAKQINMTARGTEIVLKIIQKTETPEDMAELSAMQSFFSKVKALRVYSNHLESQIESGSHPDIYAGWPN